MTHRFPIGRSPVTGPRHGLQVDKLGNLFSLLLLVQQLSETGPSLIKFTPSNLWKPTLHAGSRNLVLIVCFSFLIPFVPALPTIRQHLAPPPSILWP
jgi:hypothetical protein